MSTCAVVDCHDDDPIQSCVVFSLLFSSLVSSCCIVSPSSCAIVIQNAANVCANHFLVMDFLLGIKQDQISAGVRHR